MKRVTTTPCQCGMHQLTRAPSKWRVKRWKRVVTYWGRGICTEHRDDICWTITREDQPKQFAWADGKETAWGYYVPPMSIDIIYPSDQQILQRVAHEAKAA